MRLKILKAMAICVLMFGCASIIILQNQKINENAQTINKVNKIDDQKDKLNKELEGMESDYKESSYGKAGVSIVVGQMDNTVISFIYPALQKKEFKAVLAMDLNHFPGDEDSMTKEDFQTLMEDGWSYCIRWNGRSDFKEYMDLMTKRFQEADIKAPQTLYVTRGYYSEELKELAKDYNIKNIIHHGESNKNIISVYDKKNDFWEIGSIGYLNESLTSYVNSAVEQGGNLVLTIGTYTSDELYNVNGMDNILYKLNTYVKEDKIIVDTIGNIKSYKNALAKDQEERNQSYQEATEQVKDELEKLEEERENETNSMNK